MPRPFNCRRIAGSPASPVFKPMGIRRSTLEEVVMTLDEFEAIRLADLEGLYQEQAAALAAALGIRAPARKLDSLAKYGIVARGEAEIYLRLPRPGSTRAECIWDHAAGVLLVTEAGGRVTDTRGAPLAFRHGAHLTHNRGVVASHGPWHDRILDTLSAFEEDA